MAKKFDGSNQGAIAALRAAGYQAGQVTSDTYVYQSEDGPTAKEKRDRQSYPADEVDETGAYVSAFMWDEEYKLEEIEAAGGRHAATAYNIRKANEALI